MKLVEAHTDIASPRVLSSSFESDAQQIMMTYIPGQPLQVVWDDLPSRVKQRVCQELWAMIQKIRRIPRPAELENGPYLCLADGTPPIDDALVRDDEKTHPPMLNDDDVRARIYANYYRFGGRKYENVLRDMLPRSSQSVFTHADIAPRNVMVDGDDCHISGLLDWEMAGWYPDYWELANITAGKSRCGDWQQVMLDTAPPEFHCDLRGIDAARAVLF